jgi:hypothetical protein
MTAAKEPHRVRDTVLDDKLGVALDPQVSHAEVRGD